VHPTRLDCDVPGALLHELVASPSSRPPLKAIREKTIRAPVCAVIGYDLDFYEHLRKLFPIPMRGAGTNIKSNFLSVSAMVT
jgi:hypothetical protein